MAQGLLPFRFEAAPRPMDLTALAGLTLVAETLLALDVDGLVHDGLRLRVRQRGYGEFDKLQAIVLIQAAGGDSVEDIRVLARDAGLARLLHRRFPSPDALHDFLARFHDEARLAQRPPQARGSPRNRRPSRRWPRSTLPWGAGWSRGSRWTQPPWTSTPRPSCRGTLHALRTTLRASAGAASR